MSNADQTLVKRINKKLILQEIRQSSPVSRARLSEITKLNKSTVSSQVTELIDENLIFEIGQGLSSGGRRPVMLVFNKNAGFAIGMDLGVDYLQAILTDLDGNIVAETSVSITHVTSTHLQTIVIDLIEQLKQEIPPCPYGLTGICLGVPGLVDNHQNLVFTPNSSWSEIPLKQLIENQFAVPVFIENEANAGAYGEMKYGSGKSYQNMIYVSISTGIGIGIIQNGKLQRGKNGFSGEMGHTIIDFNGHKCSCGNRGCWELYASEKALIQSLASVSQIKTWEDIVTLAKENDHSVLQALDSFGFYLGIGIKNLIHVFDPEMIIIRNQIIEAFPQVLNSINHTLTSSLRPEAPGQNELVVSKLEQNATALGAASIVIHHFIKEATR